MRVTHRTYDSADRPNAPTAAAGLPDYDDGRTAPARSGRRREEGGDGAASRPFLVAVGVAALVLAVALAYPVFKVTMVAAEVAEQERGFIVTLVRLTFIVVTLGLALAVLAGVRWLWKRGDVAGLVELPGGALAPVDALKERPELFSLEAIRLHYDVQRAWAEHSTFRSLTTYAPSTSWRYEYRNAAPDAPEPEPVTVAPPIDVNAGDILGQLVRGGFTRPDRLLVGFDSASGAPVAIDLRRAGMIAIAGQAGTGKSSTATLLIAQAVYHGAAVIVGDPHGDLEEGLLHRVRPLSGRLERQAVTPAEIAAAISLTHKIAQRRLSGQDAADTPVVLVIDEFTGQVVNGSLGKQAFHELLSLSTEARKARVAVVLIAHDWSTNLLGSQYGAAMRRLTTHRILHRADPGMADILLPSAAYGQRLAALRPGQALVLGDSGETAEATVPYLAPEDLKAAARGAPERPYRPRQVPAAPAATFAPTPPAPAPAAPAPGLSTADRIKRLLSDGVPRDSVAIARELNEDRGAVQTALNRLTSAGEVRRAGSPRNYTYSA